MIQLQPNARVTLGNDRAAWRAWCRANGYVTPSGQCTNGAVVYRGPSQWDGAPIVVIVTGLGKASGNAKTADMLQTWILREDIAPNTATRNGQDSSVCGDCPHRRATGGHCYVKIDKAPRSVWAAYRAGRYPDVARVGAGALPWGLMLRIGSYGDPGMVPVSVWLGLMEALQPAGHTGYTHRWQDTGADLRGLVMASVDSREEQATARAMGWGTFRPTSIEQVVTRTKGESGCPASKEAGALLSCSACRKCDGRGASVLIAIH